MIQVFVESIRRSLLSNQLVVILKEQNGDRYLSIWTDRAQGYSLILALEKKTESPRGVHDVINDLVKLSNLRIENVVISDLQNDVFQARLSIRKGGRFLTSYHEVQCSVLMGLNLALHANAPILVASEVMDKAGFRNGGSGEAAPADEHTLVQREGGNFVRLAVREDADAIAGLRAEASRLHADALPHIFKASSLTSTSVSDLTDLLSAIYNYFFLGFEDSESVGYAYVEDLIFPETSSTHAMNYLHVREIFVKSAFRNKGHGKRLMNAIRELASRRDNATIGLDVWSFNTSARAFFSKQGFVVMSEGLWLQPSGQRTGHSQ